MVDKLNSIDDSAPPTSLLSLDAASKAIDMPWKASNEIRRLLLLPLAWWRLKGIDVGQGWRCYGLPIIQKHRQSSIQIGKNMGLRSTVSSNPLGANHPVILSTRRAGAKLTIGDNFGMTGGSVVVEEEVNIGNHVLVGANSIITDTDFHPLDPDIRRIRPADAKIAPVIIEDDVFIGMNSLILKGLTIGERSIVGAGSVVTRDVPPRTIVAGNPARIIREF